MKNEKHDFNCESCPVREILDKIWEPKTTWFDYREWFGGIDEEYATQHICGYHEWCDHCTIPGHRESNKYLSKKYCVLDHIRDFANDQLHKDAKADDEWPLPTYNDTYKKLLKID